MYGKLFESMFDGTLANNWEALVVFQQMVILCDADGRVDMTPMALHRRTGIPLEIINRGIAVLIAPDPESRTSTEQGRRIKLIDPQREWGWFIVNHAHYRGIASRKDKQLRDRERMRQKRSESQSVAKRREASRSVRVVAYTDADTDADANTDANNHNAAKVFAGFWDVVHLKVGKRAAMKAFARACKDVASNRGISKSEAAKFITDAMRAFKNTPAASPSDRSPIHPTTWLNQGRYDDEVASLKQSPSKLDDWFKEQSDGT